MKIFLLINFTKRRDKKLVKKLCWEGIPPAMRGEIWPKLIPNTLNITLGIFLKNLLHLFEK